MKILDLIKEEARRLVEVPITPRYPGGQSRPDDPEIVKQRAAFAAATQGPNDPGLATSDPDIMKTIHPAGPQAFSGNPNAPGFPPQNAPDRYLPGFGPNKSYDQIVKQQTQQYAQSLDPSRPGGTGVGAPPGPPPPVNADLGQKASEDDLTNSGGYKIGEESKVPSLREIVKQAIVKQRQKNNRSR